jgi:hypothetical protein
VDPLKIPLVPYIVRTHMSRRRGAVHRWPLIVLAVLLVLGHVCELPIETLLPEGHAEAGEHGGHGDAVHAGSCEAVMTADGVPQPAPPAAGDLVPSGPPELTPTVGRQIASTSAPPPSSLFLLHAALRI